jgi:hypothetical protein
MPNWCLNKVVISNRNVSVINKIFLSSTDRDGPAKFLTASGLDELPDPGASSAVYFDPQRFAGLKYSAKYWRRWDRKNFGNSWNDFAAADCLTIVSRTELKLSWETRWAPPLRIFDTWVNLGCDVRAWFCVFETGLTGAYVNRLVATSRRCIPRLREAVKCGIPLSNRKNYRRK